MKTKSSNISGCSVCGRKLVYSRNIPVRMKCALCGKPEETSAFCSKGHYVCDDCHGKDILTIAEELCIKSDLTDPEELLREIYRLPGLNMHGPEYHSIVPAVLVAAYNNSLQKSDHNQMAVREAIRRGRDISGGMCGSHGACGAAIGAGIAYSIINGATPYSNQERGGANEITAHALMEISRLGGPRCCKRDSMLAVETFKKHIRGFIKTVTKRYACRQFPKNSRCIGQRCPYYPDIEKQQ